MILPHSDSAYAIARGRRAELDNASTEGTVGNRHEQAILALVFLNSMGWVPVPVHDAMTPVSGWCLLTAVAALGVKTSLKALAEVGPAPVGVMVIQTVLLALLVIGGITLIG